MFFLKLIFQSNDRFLRLRGRIAAEFLTSIVHVIMIEIAEYLFEKMFEDMRGQLFVFDVNRCYFSFTCYTLESK